MSSRLHAVLTSSVQRRLLVVILCVQVQGGGTLCGLVDDRFFPRSTIYGTFGIDKSQFFSLLRNVTSVTQRYCYHVTQWYQFRVMSRSGIMVA